MGRLAHKRIFAILTVSLVVISGSLMAGCHSDSQMSNRDLQEIKQGPPKEMPAAARAEMQKASHGGPPAGSTPTGNPTR